jgi:hypothetical protein
MTLRRTLRALVVSATALVLAAAPAQATPGAAVAAGSVGSVRVHLDSEPVTVDPIAACDSAGPQEGSGGDVEVEDLVGYENGRSTCTVDDEGEVASVEVTGGLFWFDGLREFGGPRISLAGYTVRCDTSSTGSTSSIQLSGLSGISAPADLPVNHLVTIANPSVGQPPLATVTLNEAVVPIAADGGSTVNLMHIRLFPAGPGQNTGDVIVGSVHCAPVT